MPVNGICQKCGKPATAQGGRRCAPCFAVYMREWNAKNPDKSKRIREKRSEKHKALCAEWRSKNVDRLKAYRKAHAADDARRQREFRKKNPALAQARVTAYRAGGRYRAPSRRGPHPVTYIDVIRRDPCSYCGKEGGAVDHIVPLHSGGGLDWDNLASTCRECNSSKGTKPLLLWLLSRSA